MTRRYPIVGSGAVIEHSDTLIALGARKKEPWKNHWVFPGGKVELHERIKDTAVREVEEETGLVVALTHYIGHFEQLQVQHRIVFLYRAIPLFNNKTDLQGGGDLLNPSWFSWDEAEKLALTPLTRQMFDAYRTFMLAEGN